MINYDNYAFFVGNSDTKGVIPSRSVTNTPSFQSDTNTPPSRSDTNTLIKLSLPPSLTFVDKLPLPEIFQSGAAAQSTGEFMHSMDMYNQYYDS